MMACNHMCQPNGERHGSEARGIRCPQAARRRRPGLRTAISILATTAVALGQDRDYGPGFRKLYDLGLPDVANAAYVNLQTHSGRGLAGDPGSHLRGELKLGDRAWLIEEDGGDGGPFVVHGARVVRVHDHERLLRE